MPAERIEANTTSPTPRSANLRALLALVDGLFFTLLAGVAFLLVIHWLVVDLRVMPVTRARLVEVHEFLTDQAAESHTGDLYFLGSSVLLEGVDCTMIDPVLPDGTQSYNLALMGAGAPQWMLIADALRQTQPAWVIMTIDLTGVTGLQKIPEEGMAIAEYWNFFTPAAHDRFAQYFTPEQLAALDKSDIASLLDFRVFPIGAFDMYMREVSKPGLRYDGYTTNFKNPWVRKTRVSDASTERWITDKVNKASAQDQQAMDEQIAMIDELIGWFADKDVSCAMVVAPVNPRLARAFGDEETERVMTQLSALADRTNTPLLDHRTLLDESDYADHVHPYEPGRIKWSEKLATDLGEMVRTGSSETGDVDGARGDTFSESVPSGTGTGDTGGGR